MFDEYRNSKKFQPSLKASVEKLVAVKDAYSNSLIGCALKANRDDKIELIMN